MTIYGLELKPKASELGFRARFGFKVSGIELWVSGSPDFGEDIHAYVHTYINTYIMHTCIHACMHAYFSTYVLT